MNSIKPNKLGLTCGITLLLGGCQITQPNDVNEHSVYQDDIEFQTSVKNVQRDLHQLVAPLTKREEVGALNIALEGGNLNLATKQKMEADLSKYLLMPVTLTYQSSTSQQIAGAMNVEFEPETCRFNLQKYAVSRQTCEMLRNRYVSLADKSTWLEGVQYEDGNSALSTGAVQRLFKDKIKSAEKQSVTGE